MCDIKIFTRVEHRYGWNILDKNDHSLISESSTGKHLRHARDHFALLIDCISSPPPHVLSYDKRVRNTPVETNLAGARAAFLDIIDRLEKVVPGVDLNEPMTLHAVTPYIQIFETTFGREVSWHLRERGFVR